MVVNRPQIFRTPGQQMVEAKFGQPVEVVLRARYAEGKTQAEIAEELGVSRHSIVRWMRDLGIESRYLGPRKARVA